MSVTIDQILQAVRDDTNNLALALNGNAVTVVVRKAGRRQAKDPTTLIMVSKKPTAEVRKRFASGYDLTTFVAQVTVVSPNNDDQSANLGTYASWRDSIVNAFRKRPDDAFGLQGIRDVRAAPGEFLPNELIDKNYDFLTVDVSVEAVTAR